MYQVTIKDVAKKLGVSISTVSRAFNDKYDIKKDTKELILRTAEEMGYHPNPIAQKLSKRRSFNIGVVVPEFITEYYSRIILGIQDVLVQKGYQVVILSNDYNQEHELHNVKTLIHNSIEGILLAPSESTINQTYYQEQIKNGYPMVFFNRASKNTEGSKVLFDNEKWALFATEHLIREGYDKIYHMSIDQTEKIARDRMAGFKRAMEKSKIDPSRYKIISAGNSIESGSVAFRKLFNNGDVPDAIFCGNDDIALGVMHEMKKVGYADKKIGLMGFTETRHSPYLGTPLSSVKQPTYEMGKIAAELLLKQIETGINANETIVLDGEINLRDSSKNKA